MNAQLTYELNLTRVDDLHRRAAEARLARQVATVRRLTLGALRRRATGRPAGAAADAAWEV